VLQRTSDIAGLGGGLEGGVGGGVETFAQGKGLLRPLAAEVLLLLS
jgi:hypothetical protein